MEFLPCPFCGGVPAIATDPLRLGMLFVKEHCTPDCGRIGVSGAWGTEKALLAAQMKWNTRSTNACD